jgi:hypothetical protein
MSNQFFTLNVPAGSGVGVALFVGNLGRKDFVVNGSFDGRLTLEGSENGVNYAGFHTFTGGATAQYEASIPEILQYVRVSRVFATGPAPSVTMGAELSAAALSGNSPAYEDLSVPQEIHVELTGDDNEGDGSPGNPFRTWQRSIQMFTSLISPNKRTKVISTLGVDETFAPDYTLPAILSAGYESVDLSSPFFFFGASAMLQSTPRMATNVPAADTVINGLDILSAVGDPNSDVLLITLNVARPSWAANALEGKLVFGGAGAAAFENAVVIESSPLTLKVSTRAAFGLTTPISIMEPSSTWEGSVGADSFLPGAAINILGTHDFLLQGIRVNEPTNLPGGTGLAIGGQFCSFLESCHIENFSGDYGGRYINKACFLTTVNGGINYFSGFFVYAQQSYIKGGLFLGGCVDGIFRIATVIDGDVETFNRVGSVTAGMLSLWLQNTELQNALANGFNWHGGRALLRFVNINGAPGAGVFADGGFVDLISVVGAGNAIGVQSDNGAVIRADAVTNNPLTGLLGAAGADFKAGALAAAAWPGAPFNAIDLTAVPAAPTDTLSRVFGV